MLIDGWVRSCVRPATQASVLGFRRLKQKGKKRLTALGYLPLCIPPGGSKAGPSNITRHCAKCPHTRSSYISAATSHNTALCVNGPEGRPQTPLGLRVRPSSPCILKSIPTHLGCLALAASARKEHAVFRPAKTSQPTPGKSKSQLGFVPSLWLLLPQQVNPMLTKSSFLRKARRKLDLAARAVAGERAARLKHRR